MATYLGSLCCGEGGTLKTNTAGTCGGGGGAHSGWTTLVCHSPRWCVLPVSTLLRFQGALQGHCPEWALCFMHFPVVSCSGSQVLCKSTDPDGLCAFCPSQVQAVQATRRLRAHSLRWALNLMYLPGPSHPVSQVCQEGTVPGVPCVSSRDLISGCGTPGRCELPKIPGRFA